VANGTQSTAAASNAIVLIMLDLLMSWRLDARPMDFSSGSNIARGDRAQWPAPASSVLPHKQHKPLENMTKIKVRQPHRPALEHMRGSLRSD
jgi:hypothetical protein